jgi:hypothetical protein
MALWCTEGIQFSCGFFFFLAWRLNVASNIYTDNIDSGMCGHVSSFLCNLGVEYELAMMKGVPLHNHWRQFTLVSLKRQSHQTLSLCCHVLGPPS